MTVEELTDYFAVLTNVEVFDPKSKRVLYEGINACLGDDVSSLEVSGAWVHDDTLHIDVAVGTEGRG